MDSSLIFFLLKPKNISLSQKNISRYCPFKVAALQILLRVRLSNEKIQSAKEPRAPPSKARKRTADLLTKPAIVPAFIQFRLEFREKHKYSPTSPGIVN
jgi:hypothetical protein